MYMFGDACMGLLLNCMSKKTNDFQGQPEKILDDWRMQRCKGKKDTNET
jgi:hypothetical protein